jgi:hypothetical protein
VKPVPKTFGEKKTSILENKDDVWFTSLLLPELVVF